MGIILFRHSLGCQPHLRKLLVSRKWVRQKGKRGHDFLMSLGWSEAGLGISSRLIHNQNKFLSVDKTAKEVEPCPSQHCTSQATKQRASLLPLGAEKLSWACSFKLSRYLGPCACTVSSAGASERLRAVLRIAAPAQSFPRVCRGGKVRVAASRRRRG